MADQSLAPDLAETRHLIQDRFDHGLAAPDSVVSDREAVRLIPQPLQQIETLASPRQDHWFFDVGQPHFLQPLCEATQGHVVDAELMESLRGRGNLSWAAVYHHQRGGVG